MAFRVDGTSDAADIRQQLHQFRPFEGGQITPTRSSSSSAATTDGGARHHHNRQHLCARGAGLLLTPRASSWGMDEAKVHFWRETSTITNNAIVGGIYQCIMVSYADQVNCQQQHTVEGYTDITSWTNAHREETTLRDRFINNRYNALHSATWLTSVWLWSNNMTIPLGCQIGDTSILSHHANDLRADHGGRWRPLVLGLIDDGFRQF